MNRTDLERLVAGGARTKYLYFWRPEDRNGHFGQWYPSPFTDGIDAYPTAEHFMMAAKARLFGDPEMPARILAAGHPAEAKKLGGQVHGFDEETWRRHRTSIVVRGNLAKFDQHPALRAALLATKERVLVEASPLDRIWGVGLAADDPAIADPRTWRGQNLLGFALMEVRAMLAG